MLSRKADSKYFDSCHAPSPMARCEECGHIMFASLSRLHGTVAEQHQSCGCCKEPYLSTDIDLIQYESLPLGFLTMLQTCHGCPQPGNGHYPAFL